MFGADFCGETRGGAAPSRGQHPSRPPLMNALRLFTPATNCISRYYYSIFVINKANQLLQLASKWKLPWELLCRVVCCRILINGLSEALLFILCAPCQRPFYELSQIQTYCLWNAKKCSRRRNGKTCRISTDKVHCYANCTFNDRDKTKRKINDTLSLIFIKFATFG